MIIFYFLFFFTYKYFYKLHIPIIGTITVLLAVVMYLNNFPEKWVASSFAFPLGLIVGEHFNAFIKFIFSRKGILTTIFLSVFGLSFFLVHTENLVSLVFMRNSICLAAIIILLYFCSFFTLKNHAVTRYLNKYSTEIYLSQFIWLQLTASYGWNYMIRMPIVITATLVSAMLLHPVVTLIKKTLLSIH